MDFSSSVELVPPIATERNKLDYSVSINFELYAPAYYAGSSVKTINVQYPSSQSSTRTKKILMPKPV
jgi:hypothetical protein